MILTRFEFRCEQGKSIAFVVFKHLLTPMQLYKTLRYFSWRAFGFWTIISLFTDALLLSAFIIRVIGIRAPDDGLSDYLHYHSFQVLSFVAPFIWSVHCFCKRIAAIRHSHLLLGQVSAGITSFGNDAELVRHSRTHHRRRWVQVSNL